MACRAAVTGDPRTMQGHVGESERRRLRAHEPSASPLAQWARDRSLHGDVAYLHTGFFGGVGFHAAGCLARRGYRVGPDVHGHLGGEAEDHHAVVTDRGDMAINVLLRWWDVRGADGPDGFAAVGLDRWRWTDERAALTGR